MRCILVPSLRLAGRRKAVEKERERPAPGEVFVYEHCDVAQGGQHGEPGERALEAKHPRAQLIPPVIPYVDGSTPVRPFRFPLSPDHQLITLIQFNVLRATLTNMAILSILHTIPPECQAALAIPASLLFDPPALLPPLLEATPLQRSTAHEAWIDTVPDPAMRDNLIRCGDTCDLDDLCDDLMGGLYEGFNDADRRGIMVWSDPWCVESWEISDGFAAKWGFLLRGCHALMDATNRWRELRGEERLLVEV